LYWPGTPFPARAVTRLPSAHRWPHTQAGVSHRTMQPMQFASYAQPGLPGVAPQGNLPYAIQGSTTIQGFASRGVAPTTYTVAAPSVATPLTPKSTGITTAMAPVTTTMNMAAGTQKIMSAQYAEPTIYRTEDKTATTYIRNTREQALEQRVRELESQLAAKEKTIQELQGSMPSGRNTTNKGSNRSARSPGRGGSGFRKVSESRPVIRYIASDQDDPIDVRLEEFYNSTGSAIQFRRINRGFYRFGDSIVELDIINHKLMARTEDGWNRGKFGPIEKFLMYYENIEREKAGILPDDNK